MSDAKIWFRKFVLLNNRAQRVIEEKITEEQVGFRSGRGCEEKTFVMRQLAENMIEKDKKLYAVFVGLMIRYVGRSCGWCCKGTVR